MDLLVMRRESYDLRRRPLRSRKASAVATIKIYVCLPINIKSKAYSSLGAQIPEDFRFFPLLKCRVGSSF
jgi:hypothetical protein